MVKKSLGGKRQQGNGFTPPWVKKDAEQHGASNPSRSTEVAPKQVRARGLARWYLVKRSNTGHMVNPRSDPPRFCLDVLAMCVCVCCR